MISPILSGAPATPWERLIHVPLKTDVTPPTGAPHTTEAPVSQSQDGYVNGVYEGVYGGVPGLDSAPIQPAGTFPRVSSHAETPASASSSAAAPDASTTAANTPAAGAPSNQQQWVQYYSQMGQIMTDGNSAGLQITDPIDGATGAPYAPQDPLIYGMGAAGADPLATKVDSASPEWMAGYNQLAANPDAAWQSWCADVLPNQKAMNEQLNPDSAQNLQNMDQSKGGVWVSGPGVQIGAPVVNPDV